MSAPNSLAEWDAILNAEWREYMDRDPLSDEERAKLKERVDHVHSLSMEELTSRYSECPSCGAIRWNYGTKDAPNIGVTHQLGCAEASR